MKDLKQLSQELTIESFVDFGLDILSNYALDINLKQPFSVFKTNITSVDDLLSITYDLFIIRNLYQFYYLEEGEKMTIDDLADCLEEFYESHNKESK